ncbi:MAG: hypothetical protein V4508_04895 [Pseudomonadota bacterium]
MKNKAFWVRRFLWATGMAWMFLMGVYLLRGASVDEVLSEAFVWALVSSAVFTGSRYYKARRGIACALCKDTVGQ